MVLLGCTCGFLPPVHGAGVFHRQVRGKVLQGHVNVYEGKVIG